ncbi:MAG: phosphopentomutase [Candidatus Gastranaerophilales bacterium]|nr:phosphopentomutase [Candidatus Gastranaerophilales bacterium]
MKRAIIIVIDSMGVGAMDDAPEYKDTLECNTLCNVAKCCGGLNIPNLQKMGLGNILDIQGVPAVLHPLASYGKMLELSKGKDTTTGHWELAGLVLDEPFRTWPEGFPKELIDKFIEKTGCRGILGNYPASGTQIIEDLGEEHKKSAFPIVYTSADSVFQIACDVDIIPLETLYNWCEIARELLNEGYNTSRVIARPFKTTKNGFERISKDRRDYSLEPFKPTVLNEISEQNGRVLGIGKIEDIFVKSGITHAIHTGKNKEGLEILLSAIKNEFEYDKYLITEKKEYDKELIFLNLVDTDMLFGHRNDAIGYGSAIEEIDTYLDKYLDNMTKDDLLIITADHGCDPTVEGTDHTREHVPLLIYSKVSQGKKLGLIKGFTFVADKVRSWVSR